MDNNEYHEMTYEQAFESLEKLLEKLNQPGLSLEDSINLFEKADQLVQVCQKKIDHAEKRIEMIIKTRQDGSVETAPF
jgi:exodeoxyribonuclease VII small subunit